jgi:hypothetical protein
MNMPKTVSSLDLEAGEGYLEMLRRSMMASLVLDGAGTAGLSLVMFPA